MRNLNDAFDQLIQWIVPTEAETQAAASHRSSIEAALRARFGMTSFFRVGSFGHGTSLSGISDVDYFAVMPASNLSKNSGTDLRTIKEALAARFPRTEVHVSSPSVVVPFGSTAAERHEITPAFVHDVTKTYTIYGIPDRADGWMKSAPLGHNAYTNAQNDRLNKKAKQVVRLVKLWNHWCSAGIRSLYLELRTIEYLSTQSTIIYPIDVYHALRHIQSKGLASMQDPLGLSGYVVPCTEAVAVTASTKLDTAVGRASRAVTAEGEMKTAEAFELWTKIFGGYFPSYG